MQDVTRQPVGQSSWQHEPVITDIRTEISIDGTECFTASGSCVKIWEVDSGALLRTINLNGTVKTIFSAVDEWGISHGALKSGKEKGSEIEKLLHIPSKEDVLLRCVLLLKIISTKFYKRTKF